MVTNEQIVQMIDEYNKDGKFKEFIDKACICHGTCFDEEIQKAIVWEYYKSVLPDGCNKER